MVAQKTTLAANNLHLIGSLTRYEGSIGLRSIDLRHQSHLTLQYN